MATNIYRRECWWLTLLLSPKKKQKALGQKNEQKGGRGFRPNSYSYSQQASSWHIEKRWMMTFHLPTHSRPLSHHNTASLLHVFTRWYHSAVLGEIYAAGRCSRAGSIVALGATLPQKIETFTCKTENICKPFSLTIPILFIWCGPLGSQLGTLLVFHPLFAPEKPCLWASGYFDRVGVQWIQST